MSIARHHAEWLSLVPVSGPFLSLPMLMEAFPQGLDAHDPEHARLLRQAYEEWDDSFQKKNHDPTIHSSWIRFVLTKTLEFDESLLSEGQAISQTLHVEVPEHGELLKPNVVLNDPATKKARMLIQKYPRTQDLTSYVVGSRWKASPDTRMTDLLHATGVRLGLVTNGQHWMLVDAPKGETTGYASWYASLWQEERITLQAFRTLLSMTRFFGVSDDENIEALLTKIASNQQEVTDQLGYQVRRAVEVLIQSLDQADQDHGRELLAGVSEAVLYESALTVMMRLVFLLCAEERQLIPTKPFPVYEQNYSVSMISKQLREIADQHGEELLEHRFDAWRRLLTAFRCVYGGVRHDDMHVPAYGGRLFDPDRFPFLEGRLPETTWEDTEANPLPVNNRTALHLLEALQLLQIKVPGRGPAEARRLSFRALDIEQIGHVYEGLLDHTAVRAKEPYLGLTGSKNKEPEVLLSALEKQLEKGEEDLVTFLKKETGRTPKSLQKALNADADEHDAARFRTACQTEELWERVKPFAGLIRDDTFGYPVVIPKGSVFVTAGTDRRSSGTHYTPRSLTEPIVQYTLEPLVYVGPAEGKPKSEWKLKSAADLLDLKICDMACGSGAFLVQAARYMAERLMEAWDFAERAVGSGEWSVGSGETGEHDDGTAELSRPRSVAKSNDADREVLPADTAVPERRAVRNDESDSPSVGIDSSEHRGRPGEAIDEGFHELSEHRQRLAEGSGDAPDSLPESRPDEHGTVQTATPAYRRNQQDDDGTAEDVTETPLKSPAPPLPTLHTPHPGPRTPIPRITPEGQPATGAMHEQLIPDDPNERTTYAMRIIAQRCLYGVDVNPLAAEMAKLSLWLLTLAKDKPFEFLDHAIRCGDSLVGIHDIDQLRHFTLKPDADDAVLFKGPLNEAVDQAINLRLRLEDLPANTIDDVQRQEELLAEAEDKIARLRCATDLLVAAEFWGEGTKDRQEKLRHAAVVAGRYVENGPTQEFEEKAKKERRDQKMFHWPLEFPEVIIKRSGFDAFVGNPPFMGGTKVSTNLGGNYLAYLRFVWGKGNRADFCAYFFRRTFTLLHNNGHIGLLATNTISQTDTREMGLANIEQSGGRIRDAVPTVKWPGDAAIEVARIVIAKSEWRGRLVLNGKPVDSLSSFLAAEESEALPQSLKCNSKGCYQGSKIYSNGFLLAPDQAVQMLSQCPEEELVIRPYLDGRDVNTDPLQEPSRYVIDFREWEEHDARRFPMAMAHVETHVRPERLKSKYHDLRNYWWRFQRPRREMYEAISNLERVLVTARVSSTCAVVFVRNGIVLNEKLIVFPFTEYGVFSVLQSELHWSWVRKYAATLGGKGINYSPTDCYDTLPFPMSVARLNRIGEILHVHRAHLMQQNQEGLTKTYNRFHNPNKASADIAHLRALHVQMDQAVAAAYGWDDLDLDHGFHETKQGLRFTISEPARREVLQRLLKLNHERYEEEAGQGLHPKKRGAGTRKWGAKKKSTKKTSRNQTPSLFDKEADE